MSHQVSLIAVRAGALQVAAKDSDAREAARTIRFLSVNTLDELRHMVTLVRRRRSARQVRCRSRRAWRMT
ncbi:hypothetical protein GCM10010272_60460 [Streptomyces lateritius]|nr:hypothetical protein GCM10010272_60460 [Streptomyces lateritius]